MPPKLRARPCLVEPSAVTRQAHFAQAVGPDLPVPTLILPSSLAACERCENRKCHVGHSGRVVPRSGMSPFLVPGLPADHVAPPPSTDLHALMRWPSQRSCPRASIVILMPRVCRCADCSRPVCLPPLLSLLPSSRGPQLPSAPPPEPCTSEPAAKPADEGGPSGPNTVRVQLGNGSRVECGDS
jgi:hypothetical protein